MVIKKDDVLVRVEKTALQRFKHQNLVLKEFGRDGLLLFRGINGKRTCEELCSKYDIAPEKANEIMEWLLEKKMVKVKVEGKGEPLTAASSKAEAQPQEQPQEQTEIQPAQEEQPQEKQKEVEVQPEEQPSEQPQEQQPEQQPAEEEQPLAAALGGEEQPSEQPEEEQEEEQQPEIQPEEEEQQPEEQPEEEQEEEQQTEIQPEEEEQQPEEQPEEEQEEEQQTEIQPEEEEQQPEEQPEEQPLAAALGGEEQPEEQPQEAQPQEQPQQEQTEIQPAQEEQKEIEVQPEEQPEEEQEEEQQTEIQPEEQPAEEEQPQEEAETPGVEISPTPPTTIEPETSDQTTEQEETISIQPEEQEKVEIKPEEPAEEAEQETAQPEEQTSSPQGSGVELSESTTTTSEHLTPAEQIIKQKYGDVGVKVYHMIDGHKTAQDILDEVGISEDQLIEMFEFMERQGIIKLEHKGEDGSVEGTSKHDVFSPLVGDEAFKKDVVVDTSPIQVPEKKTKGFIKDVSIKTMLLVNFGSVGLKVWNAIDGKKSDVDMVVMLRIPLYKVRKILEALYANNAIDLHVLTRKEIMKRYGDEAYTVFKRYGREGVALYEIIDHDIPLKEMARLITQDKNYFVQIFIFIHHVLGVDVPLDKDVLLSQL